MRKGVYLGMSLLIWCACGVNKQKQDQRVGDNRDSHGCLGSAGYVWSEVASDCIRLFETGLRLEAPNGESCYLVFGKDSLQTELFFSNGQPNEILERRTLPKGGYVWNVEDDDTKNVRFTDGKWLIEQRGKVLYGN